MFTDIHTHAFHPKIAYKAVEHLNSYYSVACAGDGTITDLLQREKKAGVDRCVVLCAATEPAQVIPANNYAIMLQNEHPARPDLPPAERLPEVIAFGTIHPGFVEWEKQLRHLKEAGIKGIKLHPDFQNFWLNDPRLLPMFEQAQDDFIFEIHIGDYLPPDKNPSCPYKAAALLDAFPRLRMIAAHMGGYQQWTHALTALAGRDVWLDTSSTSAFIDPALLQQLLRKHPREKILFGSDYPLYDPSEELHRLQKVTGFTDAEIEEIMGNAEGVV